MSKICRRGITTNATADAMGMFSLDTAEILSSTLVLRVMGNGAEMRAMAVSSTTDIDPVSEYVLSQIQSAVANPDVSMAYFSNTEVESFLSSIDMLAVDLTGMTVSASMAALTTADSGSLAVVISADATPNLAGSWTYVETSGANECGDPLGVTETVALTVSQVGNSITVVAEGQVIATGTLSGNSIVGLPLDGDVEGNGSWVETSQIFTVAPDNNTINATLYWTWTAFSGGAMCTGMNTAVVTRN